MKINKSHHIDKSEQNSAGLHEYLYEYDIYEFSIEDTTLVARTYSNSPNEIHFLRKEVNGERFFLTDKDLVTKIFLKARKYSRENGFEKVNFLTDAGYTRV